MNIVNSPLELRIHLDEAGRWPLAWPVYVGAVVSLRNFDKSPFKDSKQLSATQRERCYWLIEGHQANANVVYGSGSASAEEIDRGWIMQALQLASLRAIGTLLLTYYQRQRRNALHTSTYGEDLLAMLQLDTLFAVLDEHLSSLTSSQLAEMLIHILSPHHTHFSFHGIILDGNHTFGLEAALWCNVTTIIKGDQKNPLISMASIVAKVERDAYMSTLKTSLAIYHFETHKGYWTAYHRSLIQQHGLSPEHRYLFCKNIISKKRRFSRVPKVNIKERLSLGRPSPKPALLLHICCAPDLSRPLNRLKNHFKLYLFWYNPNIHPRKEHDKRYEQFIKLVWLERGDYEIVEDRYDPKEFFDAMYEKKDIIHEDVKDADYKTVLKKAGEMEERSDRCNPCYLMRLEQAAKNAVKHHISYFTSTLLISPKKKMDKLFKRWVEAEHTNPGSKFLRFDFIKNEGYKKASDLTKKHWLRRQNYCWCGRTIPKPGERKSGYVGG